MLALLVISTLPLVGCETQEEPDLTTPEDMGVQEDPGMQDDLAGAEGAFGEWDANADMALDEMEFREIGYFDDWDTDAEIGLSEDEFTTGIGELEGGTEMNIDATAFATWDENGDALLEEEEFYSGYFDAVDADDSGTIEQGEIPESALQTSPGGPSDMPMGPGGEQAPGDQPMPDQEPVPGEDPAGEPMQ